MKTIVTFFFLIALTGCASKPMIAGAEKVLLTRNPVPSGCQFLGEVSGAQGNVITADITSDKNLMQGARNELRNNALKLEANYVVLQNQSQSNNSDGVGGTFSATVFGNAYKCTNNNSQ